MTTFRLFAGTNVGLRENNEDNFTVCPDLTENEWLVPADSQQTIPLGSRGCVMVVADGMGGQNAGEVASAIAVDTVQRMFSPQNMPSDVLHTPDNIKSFLKKVVREADILIKVRAKKDVCTQGMGSTIVIAWLVGSRMYLAWLGDSRAYSYIPGRRIRRLTKDHSYVQQLVDGGALTETEAMGHPNSNVITRSLGDTSQRAKADVAECDVEKGEIFLLCSDGLCGVCQDEDIEAIVEAGCGNLAKCKEQLTMAALAAGGSDNITIALLQVVDAKQGRGRQTITADERAGGRLLTIPNAFALVLGLCLLLALCFAGYSLIRPLASHGDAPDISVSLKLFPNTLANNGKVKFQVDVSGCSDTAVFYQYDRHLIKLDSVRKTITLCRGVAFDKDSTVRVMAICKADTAKKGIASLIIKGQKAFNENPQSVEKQVEGRLGGAGLGKILKKDSCDNKGKNTANMTPSKDSQNEITPSSGGGVKMVKND